MTPLTGISTDNNGGKTMTHTPTPWSIDALGYLRGPESENILENHDNAALTPTK